eukprot:scaffold49395_cov65-Phaeocystis_antarctica.AAC.2
MESRQKTYVSSEHCVATGNSHTLCVPNFAAFGPQLRGLSLRLYADHGPPLPLTRTGLRIKVPIENNVLLFEKRIDTEVVLLIARVGRLRPRFRPEEMLVLPRRLTLLGVAATVVGCPVAPPLLARWKRRVLDECAVAKQRCAVALVRPHILQVRVPHLIDPHLARGLAVPRLAL